MESPGLVSSTVAYCPPPPTHPQQAPRIPPGRAAVPLFRAQVASKTGSKTGSNFRWVSKTSWGRFGAPFGGVPGGIWELFWALFRCSSWEAFRRPLWGRNSALWEAKLGAKIKQKRRRVDQKSTFRPSASELVWGAVPEPFGHHFSTPKWLPNRSPKGFGNGSEKETRKRAPQEPQMVPKTPPEPASRRSVFAENGHF